MTKFEIRTDHFEFHGDFDQGGEVLDMAVEAYNSEASSDAE